MQKLPLFIVIDNTGSSFGESTKTLTTLVRRLEDSLRNDPVVAGREIWVDLRFVSEMKRKSPSLVSGRTFRIPRFPDPDKALWSSIWVEFFRSVDDRASFAGGRDGFDDPVVLFLSIDDEGWTKLCEFLRKRDEDAEAGHRDLEDYRILSVFIDGKRIASGYKARVGGFSEERGGISLDIGNAAAELLSGIELLCGMTRQSLEKAYESEAAEWDELEKLLAEDANNDEESDSKDAAATTTGATAESYRNDVASEAREDWANENHELAGEIVSRRAEKEKQPMSASFISPTENDPFGPATTLAGPVSGAADARAPSPGPTASGGKSINGVCPFCYTKQALAEDKPCPNPGCYSNRRGIPLPPEIFTHELFPIVIVGASSSGKSHFLAAMKHLLVNDGFWGDGDGNGFWKWAFVPYYNRANADDQAVDNPYVVYETNLYERKLTLDSTKRDDDHPPLLLSCEYLHPFRRMFDEPRFSKKPLLVAVTDTAGEHAQGGSIGAFEENYPVLKRLAKGAIIMLDPKEIGNNATETANGVLSMFKRGRRKSNMPIALCVSKIDELVRGDEPVPSEWLDETTNTDKRSTGRLVLPDIDNNSHDILDWMRKNSLRATANDLENSFRYHACFATSALGIDPFQMDADGNPVKSGDAFRLKKDGPHSLRVLDPLLWILWQHGKIGGTAVKPSIGD